MSEPRIALCGDAVALPWCDATWRDEPGELRDVALTLIEHAHDRYLGLTPALAMSLAHLVTHPAVGPQGKGPWGPVLERLQAEQAGPAAGRGVDGLGFVLSASPVYAVQRLALPLVEAAERTVGTSLLFAQHAEGLASWTERDCAEHEQRLVAALARIAASEDGAWKLFFRERALALASLAAMPQPPALAETEPGAAALLAGLRPELVGAGRRSRRSRAARFPVRKRVVHRIREAGFVGVHTTRDPDIRDMLTSEFLNPELLFLDRVLNTGYQALEREPKREHLRHVLIAGVLPPSLGAAEADVARSAWYEACLRLTPLLLESGLSRSEYRLLSAGPRGTWSLARFRLEEFAAVAASGGEMGAGFRHGFLGRLGWVPHAAEVMPVRQEASVAHEGDGLDFAWIGDVWREHQRSDPTLEDEDNTLNAQHYSYAHVVAALPASARPPGGDRHWARVLRRDHLRFAAEEARHASLAWVGAARATAWGYDAAVRPQGPLTPCEASDSLAARVGRLAGACVAQWEEEIFSG